MDIKQKLQTKFPEVKDAFFEKELGALFLRVELTIRDFDLVVKKSNEISAFLDENEPTEKEYFLDVYSAGTETLIELENLKDHIDAYVQVKLEKPIKDKDIFIGNLLEVNEQNIIVRWNAKGQFRKQEIELSNIKSVNLATKF